MTDDAEAARRRAQQDYQNSPHQQMLTEQQADHVRRTAYNNELARLREQNSKN
jgi:hypothetical protein